MEVYTTTLIEKKDKDGNTQNFTANVPRQHYETLKTIIVHLIKKWNSILSSGILMFSFNLNNALQSPLSVIPS